MVHTFPICCARSVYRDEKLRCSVFTPAMSRLVVIHRREEWQRDDVATLTRFPCFLLFRFSFLSFCPLHRCFPSKNRMVHRRSLLIVQLLRPSPVLRAIRSGDSWEIVTRGCSDASFPSSSSSTFSSSSSATSPRITSWQTRHHRRQREYVPCLLARGDDVDLIRSVRQIAGTLASTIYLDVRENVSRIRHIRISKI